MKYYKTFSLLIFSFLIIMGCNKIEQKKIAINSSDYVHELEGVKLKPPLDSSYKIETRNNEKIEFKKSSTKITVQIEQSPTFKNAEDFFAFGEQYVNDKMKSLEMKSIHFSGVTFKRTTCLKIDGTFRDSLSKDKTKEYLSYDGYLCSLPNSKFAEIRIDYHSYEKGIPNKIISEFNSFIENIKFNNLE